MGRKSPITETLRRLYARSGNMCAFPECEHPIFDDNGVYVAELCHIKGANKGGQRYDENQDDEERRAYNNLLFLCHRHHKVTDDENKYPLDKMIEMKNSHEAKFNESGRKLANEMLRQVLSESKSYWDRQICKPFNDDDLKIKRELSRDIFDLFRELEEMIEHIRSLCDICAKSDSPEVIVKDLQLLFEKGKINYSNLSNIPYYENSFENRNWELHNLAFPNCFSHLTLCLRELEVKVFEKLLSKEPGDMKLKSMLEKSRDEFDNLYGDIYYHD